MALDIKKWLTEEMGFSEAEATEMAPKFTAERAAKIETSVGLLSANTAAQTKIKQTQAELQAANDRLNAEMAEWATLSTQEKAEATELRAAVEAARVRATQLETRLTTLATQHGVDPKPLLEGAAVVPPVKEKVVPPVQDDRFAAIGNALNYSLDLPANLEYIRDEHQALTGERLDTREIVKIIKVNAGVKGATVDPIQIWEDKYGIPAKRDAKSKADLAKTISDAEARGEERARSQQALPNATQPGRHSPVFGRKTDTGEIAPRTSALKRPQPGSSVQGAVNALRTHKYAQTKSA